MANVNKLQFKKERKENVKLMPGLFLNVILQCCFLYIFPQDSSVSAKEPETAEHHAPAPTRSTKHRAPKPPVPPPPIPTAVSATPASISISPNPPPPISVPSTNAGWERSQSTLPSVSNTVDEMFASNLVSKPSNVSKEKEKEEESSANIDVSPTFTQVSSVFRDCKY